MTRARTVSNRKPASGKAPERGEIHLVGIGPGEEAMITVGALKAIEIADEVWLQSLGPLGFEMPFLRPYLIDKKVVNLNDFYDLPHVGRGAFYTLIEQRLVHLAERGKRITFLLPGNPLIWVQMTGRLKELARAGKVALRISPGVSFLDVIWHHAPFDVHEFQLRVGSISSPDISTRHACVIGQVGDGATTGSGLRSDGLFTSGLQRFCADLARLYPPEHPVYLSGHRQIFGHGEAVHRLTTVRDVHKVLPFFEDVQYCVIIPALPADTNARS